MSQPNQKPIWVSTLFGITTAIQFGPKDGILRIALEVNAHTILEATSHRCCGNGHIDPLRSCTQEEVVFIQGVVWVIFVFRSGIHFWGQVILLWDMQPKLSNAISSTRRKAEHILFGKSNLTHEDSVEHAPETFRIFKLCKEHASLA